MDIPSVRSCFPGTQDHVFLDAACVSLMPVQAAEAMERLSKNLLHCPEGDASAHHIALDQTADQPRRQAARLINAELDDIALIESTTHGLQAIASVVPMPKGSKVLVGATEFMGLAIPWIGNQATTGFAIEVISSHDGRLTVDAFARAADEHTRVILLSSVQWNNGFRANLADFAQFAEEKGIVLVVDAIQELGALPIDVQSTPVDFIVAGGHKWLNAPVGRGFLYVHPRRRARIQPAHWGYLNVTEPSEGWAEYFATPSIPSVRAYDFTTTARRLELGGTANYPGNVALGESLALINNVGKEAIESYIRSLTDVLIERLQRVGAAIVSPTEPEARSGIVTFSLGKGPQRDTELLNHLRQQRILISQRYTAGIGGLRVSIHFFNHLDDVMRLVEAVQSGIGSE